MGAPGLELQDVTPRNHNPLRESADRGAAESGAVGARNIAIDPDSADSDASIGPNPGDETDPDLATFVEAWPTLPEAVRAGIVAMVKAAKG